MTLGYGLSDVFPHDKSTGGGNSLSGGNIFALGTGLVGIYLLGKIAFTSHLLSRRGKNYSQELEKALLRIKETAGSLSNRHCPCGISRNFLPAS